MDKKRILVVDDNRMLAMTAERVLQKQGYETASALNGREGLQKAQQWKPDLIILDIIMPSLDGIGICLQLRQWTKTPIMMLSTWGAGTGTVKGLSLGAEGYLSDAFGTDALKKRIEETLKRTTAVANPYYNPD